MMVTHDARDFARGLHSLAEQISKQVQRDHEQNDGVCGPVLLVGIRTCGAHLATRLQALLAERLGQMPQIGILDITLYRDDVYLPSSVLPQLKSTQLPGSIDERYVILVDDVYYTGRTARAALQALLDFGRPKCVRFAVLVDRGCREFPISPDFKAFDLPTSKQERVEVRMTEEGYSSDDIIRI